MTRPEVFVGLPQNKFDDKLELKDQPAIDFIKRQLAAFEKYIRKFSGKNYPVLHRGALVIQFHKLLYDR
jgi:hypothetical protein